MTKNVTDPKDAFDLWWQWAERLAHNPLTIRDEIFEAVMTLTPEQWTDRAIVNNAVRTQKSRLRPARSEDPLRMPKVED